MRSDSEKTKSGTNAEAKHNSAAARDKMKRKDYDKELARLHVELVKLQEWVIHKGLKVCVVFEGRDGAGKGGTIKAITDRVSPRVFRVIALPAPSDREKSQMYIQRYLPHLPGGGRDRHLGSELVQPCRRRAGHGFLQRRGGAEIPQGRAAGREGDRRLRGHPARSIGWR